MSLGAQPSFDAMSTFPQGFSGGLVVQGIPVLNSYPGRVFWLDSVNGSDSNRGTFARPFASLMGALASMSGQPPTVFNDVLMVKSGHNESISAARTLTTTTGSMSIDLSGVQIIGLGVGDDRPRITIGTANTACLNITASNVTLQNFLFYGNFLSIATAINVGGSTSATGIASVTASIAGNIMTVTASASGYAYPGSTLSSATSGFIRGTKIVNQISGTPGGVGSYYVNQSQTVASGTITTVARNVAILGCEFRDTSSILGFLTTVTTSATNNACDGLDYIGNTVTGLSTSATATIAQGGNTDFMTLASNVVILAANNGNASLLAKAAKVNKGLVISGNRCSRPNSTNTGGQLFSTTSTTDTGMVIDNYQVGGTAATGLLCPTGTTLGFTNNYIQQNADHSGIVLPSAT